MNDEIMMKETVKERTMKNNTIFKRELRTEGKTDIQNEALESQKKKKAH